MPIVWVYRGRWPEMQRLQAMTEDDADQAEDEGWGQRVEGLDGRECRAVEREPHAAADRFYATRMSGGKPSPPVKQPPTVASQAMPPVGGLYGTREMVAAAPARHPPPVQEPDEPPAKKSKKGH